MQLVVTFQAVKKRIRATPFLGDLTLNSKMGSTGEATDQDMLAPDLLPHPPQTSQAR